MNTKIKKNSESVVCEHQLEVYHEFDWENTKIIDYKSVIFILAWGQFSF